MSKLREFGLADNTLVIFLGDNGPNTDRYNGGMRGRKGSLHEGGVRVPCFISFPGRIKPGTTVSEIAAHIDLAPTILEMTGAGKSGTPQFDGVSLTPLLEGRSDDWHERIIFHGFRTVGSVRTQRYRMVVEPGKPPELFDMATDPGEKTDIAAQYPEAARRLKNEYDRWFEEVTKLGTKPPPIPVGYREWRLVELPAHEATLEGTLRYKGKHGWAHDWVTGWSDTDSRVLWHIDVVNTGDYEITLTYTCSQDDVGGEVQVEAGGEAVSGMVEPAHDPRPLPSPDRVPRLEVYEKVWAPLELGSLRLKKGEVVLAVKAISIPGQCVMDLKAVRVRLTE